MNSTQKEPVLAIIPARSGSKGIEHKNIRPLAGHPLLAWSIAAAKSCPDIDRVLVSTDSRHYADIAAAYGAPPPFLRPAELSVDTSLDVEFIVHALDWLDRNENYRPGKIVHLRPTCPVRDPQIMSDAIKKLSATPQATSLVSVHALEYPPCKYYRLGENGRLLGYMGEEYINLPRQSCPTGYLGNGHIDIYRVSPRLIGGDLYGSLRLAFIAPNSGDIDTPEDFEALEKKVTHSPPPLLSVLERLRPTGTRDAGIPENTIHLVVFDFDGVFTDGSVYVDENGTETVRCLRTDGTGIALLREAGIHAIILSTETNPVVAARGRKLGLETYSGCGDKAAFLGRYLAEKNIDPATVAYLGDDVNDLAAMRRIGFPACPANAHPAVKNFCRLTLSKKGGAGAVRELCDLLIGAVPGEKA